MESYFNVIMLEQNCDIHLNNALKPTPSVSVVIPEFLASKPSGSL